MALEGKQPMSDYTDLLWHYFNDGTPKDSSEGSVSNVQYLALVLVDFIFFEV